MTISRGHFQLTPEQLRFKALGDCELQFWEITAIKSGAYAELRPYGSEGKSIRVKEKAAYDFGWMWD